MTRARDVADTQDNLGGAVPPFVAGKNVVINGAFDFWQRGTSAASSNSAYVFGPDRWQLIRNGYTLGETVSRQSAGLAGFNYCARVQRDSGNTSTQSTQFQSSFATEEVIRLQGQTVTFSFYARTGANFSSSGNALTILIATSTGADVALQNYSAGVTYPYNAAITLTGGTTWTRYSVTVAIPSNAQSAGVNLYWNPTGTAGAADYYEITGVQVEIGSVATPFSRAGGTIQGELAACQRYYQRWSWEASSADHLGNGQGSGSGQARRVNWSTSQTMRVRPSLSYTGTITMYDGTPNARALTSLGYASGTTPTRVSVDMNTTGGNLNLGDYVFVLFSSGAFFEASSEL
jgi:hypothetical protein